MITFIIIRGAPTIKVLGADTRVVEEGTIQIKKGTA